MSEEMRAGFELSEKTQVHTIFFVGGGGDRDLLAMVFKPEGETWLTRYRFRYYTGPEVWDSQDEKSWYTVTAPEGEGPEKMVTSFRVIAAMTAREFDGEVCELFVNGNGIEAAELLCQQSWSHAKSTAKVEA
jgi:hypothetical protein